MATTTTKAVPIAAAIAANRSAGIPVASVRTAHRWCSSGRVPGAVQVGGRWYVSPEDLQRAMVRKPGEDRP